MQQPQKYGKYVLCERISVGGMAEVFRARLEGAGGDCGSFAIKRLLPQLAEDNRFVELFAQEAHLASQLEHPNIARVYELGQIDRDHHITMEYVPGPDLLAVHQRLRKRGERMPVEIAVYVAHATALALTHVHTHGSADGHRYGLVHLDVTPPNILLSYSGEVKLIDFGIAEPLHGTQSGASGPKGKVAYMAPEVIAGGMLDPRSDLFSLGVVLHEALTSKSLFALKNDIVTMDRVRTARIKRPSGSNPAVSAALDAVVLKALARPVDARYETAQALVDALESCLAALDSRPDASTIKAFLGTLFAEKIASELSHPLRTWDQVVGETETMAQIDAEEQALFDSGGERTEAEVVPLAPPVVARSSITEAPSLSGVAERLPMRTAVEQLASLDPAPEPDPTPSSPAPTRREMVMCAAVVALGAMLGVATQQLFASAPEDGALVLLISPAERLTIRLGDRTLETSQSPVVLREVPPGAYRLRVARSGYKEASRTIDVEAGVIATVNVELEATASAAGIIQLRLSPSSAVLTVDDQPSAVEGAERRIEVPASTPVVLKATAKGHLPREQVVTIAPGVIKNITLALPAATATLYVSSVPAGMVYIDGRLAGRTPRKIEGISQVNPVKLRLTAPGHAPIEETVNLIGRPKVRIKRRFKATSSAP